MKRLRLVLAIILATVFVLLLALPFVVDKVASTMASKRFSDGFSGQLHVGSVSTSWFRDQVLSDVSIHVHADEPISVKEVRVERTLGGLMFAAMTNVFKAVSKVSISGVRGTLEIREDGSNTFVDLLEALTPRPQTPDATAATSEKPNRFALLDRAIVANCNLVISDIDLKLIDRPTGTELQCLLPSMNFKLAGDASQLAVSLAFDGKIISEGLTAPVSVQAKCEGPLNLLKQLDRGEGFVEGKLFDALPLLSCKVSLQDLSITSLRALATFHYLAFTELKVAELKSQSQQIAQLLSVYQKNKDIFPVINFLESYNIRGSLFNMFRKMTGLQVPLCKLEESWLNEASYDKKIAARVISAFAAFQTDLAQFIATLPNTATLSRLLSDNSIFGLCPDLAGGFRLDVALDRKGLHLNEVSASILLPDRLKTKNFFSVPISAESRRVEIGLKRAEWGFVQNPTISAKIVTIDNVPHQIVDFSDAFMSLVPSDIGTDIFCRFDTRFLIDLLASSVFREQMNDWATFSPALEAVAEAVLLEQDVLDQTKQTLEFAPEMAGLSEIGGGVSFSDNLLETRLTLKTPLVGLEGAFLRFELKGDPLPKAKYQSFLGWDATKLAAGAAISQALIADEEALYQALKDSRPLLLGILTRMHAMSAEQAFLEGKLGLSVGAERVSVNNKPVGGRWVLGLGIQEPLEADAVSLCVSLSPDAIGIRGRFADNKVTFKQQSPVEADKPELPSAWRLRYGSADILSLLIPDPDAVYDEPTLWDAIVSGIQAVVEDSQSSGVRTELYVAAPKVDAAEVLDVLNTFAGPLKEIFNFDLEVDLWRTLKPLPPCSVEFSLNQQADSGVAMLKLAKDSEKLTFALHGKDATVLISENEVEGSNWSRFELTSSQAKTLPPVLATLASSTILEFRDDFSDIPTPAARAVDTWLRAKGGNWLQAFMTDCSLACDLAGLRQVVQLHSTAVSGRLELSDQAGALQVEGKLDVALGAALAEIATAEGAQQPLGLLDALERANSQLLALQEKVDASQRVTLPSFVLLPFATCIEWTPVKSKDPAADQLPFALSFGAGGIDWGSAASSEEEFYFLTFLKAVCRAKEAPIAESW